MWGVLQLNDSQTINVREGSGFIKGKKREKKRRNAEEATLKLASTEKTATQHSTKKMLILNLQNHTSEISSRIWQLYREDNTASLVYHSQYNYRVVNWRSVFYMTLNATSRYKHRSMPVILGEVQHGTTCHQASHLLSCSVSGCPQQGDVKIRIACITFLWGSKCIKKQNYQLAVVCLNGAIELKFYIWISLDSYYIISWAKWKLSSCDLIA